MAMLLIITKMKRGTKAGRGGKRRREEEEREEGC